MDKRTILAFGLSMVVLLLYVWVQERYFTPAPTKSSVPTREAPAKEAARPDGAARGASPAPAPPAPVAMPPARAEAAPAARPPQRTATVEGPLFRGVVSSEGGKLQGWTLHYRGEKPLVIVGEQGPGGVLAGGAAAEPVAMTVSTDRLQLDGGGSSGELRLSGEAAGLRVVETMRFAANSYVIEVALRVENRSGESRQATVIVPWTTREHWGTTAEQFIGQHLTEVVWSANGRVDRVDKLGTVPRRAIDGEWVGLDSIWYLSAVIPRSPGFQLVTDVEAGREGKEDEKQPAGRVTVGVQARPTIAPGQAWEGRVSMYAGPKEYERLRALGLEGTINFGGFPIPRKWGGLPMEWLGVPILVLMKWVYRYVGNYGIAIIMLTIVSKVLFYPLTVKSIRSMKAMQALQPQVNALRAKYKSDPQRAQREMMELYRKHRVNPMGGCLPMVAQIPIFYALYLALSVSVELQGASFMCVGRIFGVDLWICDLASHDPTYVLPILMGITMFVQQKMSPTTGDPRQAKMMLVMPFVFTFMFLNLPSGLVLYWTVSNVLQILQQWYMDRSGGGRAAREAVRA